MNDLANRPGQLCLIASTLVSLFIAGGIHASDYEVFVSNEKSGDVTVIDPESRQVIATIPVGKRPRGIRATPDGTRVYVAVSGTPIAAPPPLDANGNPILKKDADDDDDKGADKAADGIAVIDVAQRKFLNKLSAGSDPEQFSFSRDGSSLYISNEDVGAATILNRISGRVEHLAQVHREPEGVETSPDGTFFYVTCESDGEIFAIGAADGKVLAHFKVGGRPRSVEFHPDGTVAFIPSESAGQLHRIDAVHHSKLATVQLPKGSRPMCVKVSGDGRKVYVSTGRAGTVCVLNSTSLELLATIKVGERPWGIALSPDGKYLFAANGPSNDVSIVDLATNAEVARVSAGDRPWGVVVVPKSK